LLNLLLRVEIGQEVAGRFVDLADAVSALARCVRTLL
jgi:hypothetical protein